MVTFTIRGGWNAQPLLHSEMTRLKLRQAWPEKIRNSPTATAIITHDQADSMTMRLP